MATDYISGKPPQNTLDIAAIMRQQCEAHATIRRHGAEIIALSMAISDVDAAMRLAIDERTIDEQQTLVSAARRLTSLLNGEVPE